MSKVYFISGGNRGIGFNIVKQLSERPNTKVIATTRNLEASTELLELQKKNKNIEIVQVDINSEESISAVDEQLERVAPDGIDVLISNAAIARTADPVLKCRRDLWLEHYHTNVLGPILLLQVVQPYVAKRETKQIIFVSSITASIGGFFPISLSAYGQSKAALNYTAKELSFELRPEGFTVISLHPGVVSTEMGLSYLTTLEDPQSIEAFKASYISPEDSASHQLKVIDGLTIESSGKFLSYDGSVIQW